MMETDGTNLPLFFCQRGLSDCLYSLTHNETLLGSFIGGGLTIIAALIAAFMAYLTIKKMKEQINQAEKHKQQFQISKFEAHKSLLPIYTDELSDYVRAVGNIIYEIYELHFITQIGDLLINTKNEILSAPQKPIDFFSNFLEYFNNNNETDRISKQEIIAMLKSYNRMRFRYKLFTDNLNKEAPVYVAFMMEYDLKLCAELHARLSILNQYGNGCLDQPFEPNNQEIGSSLNVIIGRAYCDDIIERIIENSKPNNE